MSTGDDLGENTFSHVPLGFSFPCCCPSSGSYCVLPEWLQKFLLTKYPAHCCLNIARNFQWFPLFIGLCPNDLDCISKTSVTVSSFLSGYTITTNHIFSPFIPSLHTLIQYVPPNSRIFWVLLRPLPPDSQAAIPPALQNSFITTALPNLRCLSLYIPFASRCSK